MILINIEIKAQTTILTSILFLMDPTHITPIVLPNKSHKKIKVLRCLKQTTQSSSPTNDELTNNKSNKSDPSVNIHASPTNTSTSKPYI